MLKKLSRCLLALCLAVGLAPTLSFAEEANPTTGGSGLAVEGEGAPSSSDVWTFASGTYTISGTAKDAEHVAVTGDATLTLSGATIERPTSKTDSDAPAIDIQSGNTTIVLVGQNSVRGSLGYAGIHVAEGASLTIKGEGSLNAQGGDAYYEWGELMFGGGAGIGGDGECWSKSGDDDAGASFGSVLVKSGTVNAKGGAYDDIDTYNTGAGAGIGTGGISGDDIAMRGSVTIEGGEVVANGGEIPIGVNNTGGAGIGTGGMGGSFSTQSSRLEITISGGKVIATGGVGGTGAGIGGGENVDGGIYISISGGEVNAAGGFKRDNQGNQLNTSFGGAGIGGGDNGCAESIQITGGKVFAEGKNTAAGIGGGSSGAGGIIRISNQADVTAFGGSRTNNAQGGAAIGGGRYTCDSSIAIEGEAKVRAYAGINAQALGSGSDPSGKTTGDVSVSPTATVWAFNQDTTQGAFWGQNADGTLADDATGDNLVWYTSTSGADFPTTGTPTAVSSSNSTLKWQYTADDPAKLQILDGDTVKVEETLPEGFTLGNWAANIASTPQVASVSYDLNGGTGAEGVDYGTPDAVNSDGKVTLKAAPTKAGFEFLGWSDGQNTYPAGAEYAPTESVTLVAQWREVPSPTYYPVTIADKNPQGGSVDANRSSAPAGAIVTISVTPDEGFELGSLTVVDKDGNSIPVTSKGDGKYSFAMPAGKVTVSASFQSARWDRGYLSCAKDATCPIWSYGDATPTGWYHDGVHFCIANGLMTGYNETTWAPSDETSRGMVATILWRLEGSPEVDYDMTFGDVESGVWYTEAIRWAESAGVVTGYGDGSTYGPNDPVTREQMATILWRYAKYKGSDVSAGAAADFSAYPDAADVSDWAVEGVKWGVGSGMVAGEDQPDGSKLLDPQGDTDRAQMATLMMRYCAEIVK